MKIDITSMFFNSSIVGKTATAAWGTSVGKQTQPCTIYESEDVVNILSGMLYCSKTDYENLLIEEMSKSRELIMFSVFDKVFVNGQSIEGSFILLLVREHSSSHEGRMLLSYPKYAKYKKEEKVVVDNDSTMNNIAQSLGISKNDTWFVYDISIANQDTLLINACAAGSDKYKQFVGTSKMRSQEWGEIVEHSNIPDNSKIKTLLSIPNPTLPYLIALRTKPFMLLAGISGTGKSRIVRKLAQATDNIDEFKNDADRWKLQRPANFELIQVKPNWHNSMDVVGFYSNISKKYEFTPFVEFIVKAWQHKETPYFLCLDEMNLAPVEEYFAEFLSTIESRSTDENGDYITDPIIKPFKKFGEKEGKAMLIQLLGDADPIDKNPLAIHLYEKGLTLPPNLMVMGTVNMDETTFSFSRKVLDRAMSVEMNEVDYDKFLSGESEQFPLLKDLNDLLVKRPQQALEVKDEIDSEKVIDYLKAVNNLLDGTPFKLGYRAANEAMLYVAASRDFAGEKFSIEKALDEFTLMKILSRIEGDDNRLAVDENDSVLETVGKDSITDTGEDRINLLNCLRAIVRKHIGSNTETEKKINIMYRTLEREHFVSYWA